LKGAIQSDEMKALITNLRYPEHYLGPDEVTRALEAEVGTLERALAQIRQSASGARGGVLSPSFMPYVAAGIGAGALALLLAARILRKEDDTEIVALPVEGWLFIGSAVVVLAGAFLLMELYGYLLGAGVIVAGFLVLARARLWAIVGTAILFPVALWLLFDRLLGFPLP
jgi:hypothetical protein